MVTNNEITQALDCAVRLQKKFIANYGFAFRDAAAVNGKYGFIHNYEWATGFATGQYWMAYEASKDPVFKKAAMTQVADFENRIDFKIGVDHHDMGFLYSLSCVAAYRLTGSESAKQAALKAAAQLKARFHPVGKFLQAWGTLGTPENYRMIIDCLLNLPLLYWAAEQTGDESYVEVAKKHTKTASQYLLRADGSVHHTFFFDNETGEPLRGVTHQGYSNDSFWARGQAWAVYGFALAYRFTKEEVYKECFVRAYNFLVAHLPADAVPYWDLIFVDGEEPRDSSASAIAVCGLLEMAALADADLAEKCNTLADTMMQGLLTNCANDDFTRDEGVLLHGVYAKSSPYNEVNDFGVDESTCWGDYFYMEALMRYNNPQWNPYW